METAKILDHKEIEQKILRIAHQIAEYNYDEAKIVVVGVATGGYTVAQRIAGAITEIIDVEVMLGCLTMDKGNPLHGKVQLDIDLEDLANTSVVLVDDVLESGRTLAYAAKFLMEQPLKKLATAVLVDRMHPRFPIRADFVGLTLSTTLQDHIELVDDQGELRVFLK